jgi:hypothetical protein
MQQRVQQIKPQEDRDDETEDRFDHDLFSQFVAGGRIGRHETEHDEREKNEDNVA